MTEEHLRQRKRTLYGSFNSNVLHHPKNDSFSVHINQHQQQRILYSRKKNEGLICSICDGPAYGYNFDVITCESCKAFFRRNALKTNGTFKCRNHDNRCIITISTRKRCKACRLTKCFKKGMRADWILTDEERVRKRQKIEENRRLRRLLYPDLSDTEETPYVETKHEPYDYDDDEDDENNDDYGVDNALMSLFIAPVRSTAISSEDLIKIQQIKQAYTDSVRLTALSSEIPSYPRSVRITEASDMVNFPANMQATRVITYFKLLPEFNSLNEHDKLILTKYNTFTLTFIRAALNYDPFTDTYHEPNTDDCVFSGKDLIRCFSLYQYERSTNCIRNLISGSVNDRFILQVLIIIILYSKGSSISDNIDEMEPVAQDVLSIYKAQNIYVDLLWKYCENKYGYTKTIQIWIKLMESSIDAHLQAANTRHQYVKVDPVASQLAPLMKSVMLII